MNERGVMESTDRHRCWFWINQVCWHWNVLELSASLLVAVMWLSGAKQANTGPGEWERDCREDEASRVESLCKWKLR